MSTYNDVENPIDIYVIGTGMVGFNQITREAQSALRESKKIYLLDGQPSVEQHFENEYTDNIEILTEEYKKGKDRVKSYNRMADAVIQGAEDIDKPVTFALYGHPMVFVNPSRTVINRAEEKGLNVQVQPGISAMDCVYSDIAFDPAANGVQMFEATDILLREWSLNPEVPAMIWQISAIETDRHSEKNSKPERFRRFRKYLQQFYPDNHTAYLLQTAMYPIANSRQIEFQLDELESMNETIDKGSYILYLPVVEKRSIQNENLLKKVRSKEHLDDIVIDD